MRHRLQALLASRRWIEPLLVAGVTAILLCYSYYLDPGRPKAGFIGYYGAYDQSQYLAIAKILASGRLPVGNEYTYGLGMPILGLPAILLGHPRDPFILPDILLITIAVAAVYVVSTRLASRRVAIAVVALLLIASPLRGLTTMPWSTTISFFSLAVALLIVTSPARPRWPGFVGLGLLMGWSFSARFLDVFPTAAVAAVAIVMANGHRIRAFIATAIPAGLIVLAVALTQLHGLGSLFSTPYSQHLRPGGTSDQSAGQYHPLLIPRHFFETFVSGTDYGVRVAASPLLDISPYLVLFPIGAFLVLRAGRWRLLHIVTLSATLVVGLVYIAFVAGGGHDLMYQNARYWISFYPYWTLLAVIATEAGLRRIFAYSDAPRTGSDPLLERTDASASWSSSGSVRPRGRSTRPST